MHNSYFRKTTIFQVAKPYASVINRAWCLQLWCFLLEIHNRNCIDRSSDTDGKKSLDLLYQKLKYSCVCRDSKKSLKSEIVPSQRYPKSTALLWDFLLHIKKFCCAYLLRQLELYRSIFFRHQFALASWFYLFLSHLLLWFCIVCRKPNREVQAN